MEATCGIYNPFAELSALSFVGCLGEGESGGEGGFLCIICSRVYLGLAKTILRDFCIHLEISKKCNTFGRVCEVYKV